MTMTTLIENGSNMCPASGPVGMSDVAMTDLCKVHKLKKKDVAKSALYSIFETDVKSVYAGRGQRAICRGIRHTANCVMRMPLGRRPYSYKSV